MEDDRKVTEVKIFTFKGIEGFNEGVKPLIACGWVPFGRPFIVKEGFKVIIPMAKY